MNCNEIREELSALLDGELSGEARTGIETHIAECADCRQVLDRMKRVDALYRALDPRTVPAGFEEGIRAILSEKRPGRVKTGQPVWRWRIVWAAAACTAIAVSVGILRMAPESEHFNVASIGQKSEPSEPRRIVQEHDVGKRKTSLEMEAAVPGTLPPQPPSPAPTGDQAAESSQYHEEAASIPLQSAEKESRKGKAAVSAPAAPSAPPPASSAVVIPPASIATENAQNDSAAQTTLVPPKSAASATVDKEEAIDAGREPAHKEKALEPEGQEEAIETGRKPAQNNKATAGKHASPLNEFRLGRIALGSTLKQSEKRHVAGMVAPLEDDKKAMAVTEKTDAGKDGPPDRGDRKIVAGRVFLRIGDAWVEDGYPQDAQTRILRRGSKASREFFDKNPALKPLLELEGRIVFKVKKRWYCIEPAQ